MQDSSAPHSLHPASNRTSLIMFQTNVLKDYETLSRRAADWVSERLQNRPAALLCLAAGSTPMRTYELLAERGTKEPSLFASCRLLKLDEWGGLAINDPATCEYQLRTAIVTPLGLSDRYMAFDSQPPDPEAECARVAGWLDKNGPIDLCVLGLGVNGHVGFNEPAEYLRPNAQVAKLSDASLGHTMLRQSKQRPTYGLTLGMADILRSREVLILVSGRAKLEALARLLKAKITTAFPASLLHLHPQTTLFCDVAAYPDAAGGSMC
jgi:galactosamine-6-phosphate isomerase